MKKVFLVLFILLVANACSLGQSENTNSKSEFSEEQNPIVSDNSIANVDEAVATESIETDFDLTGWQDFVSNVVQADFKFHKNFYYKQIDQPDLDFLVYRFAKNEEALDQVYINPENAKIIDFYVGNQVAGDNLLQSKSDYNDYQVIKVNGLSGVSYLIGSAKVVILVQDNKHYKFVSYTDEYHDILDKMVSTFQLNK